MNGTVSSFINFILGIIDLISSNKPLMKSQNHRLLNQYLQREKGCCLTRSLSFSLGSSSVHQIFLYRDQCGVVFLIAL